MKVAVITPYFKESLDILQKCHESLKKQTYPSVHTIFADGFPNDEINNGWFSVSDKIKSFLN